MSGYNICALSNSPENEEMIELLLKHGADTNAQLEYYNYTPLYRALKKSKS